MKTFLAWLASVFRKKAAVSSPTGPDLLILGTAKAGTTSLFEFLNNLPGFSGALNKELRYFSMDHYYHQGTDWYHRQFEAGPPNIKFEATPHYLYFPAVAERVHRYQYETGKTLKFIVLLREPATRAYSAWNMERSFHQHRAVDIIENHYKYYNPDLRASLTNLLLQKEFPSFQQAVLDDIERLNRHDPLLEPSYVRKGLYARQILHWKKWFDLRHFLFLEVRELCEPALVIKKLEAFLGIKINPNTKLPANAKLNRGQYEQIPNETTMQTLEMLKEFYRPYNKELFEILGKQFDWNVS